MADTAVIVNEFGEIGFDHLLIEQAIEDTVLLENGCVCCSIRGDLVDTLLSLQGQVEKGDIPPFARAAIETTGLADPAPVLQTLMSDPRLAGTFAFHRIVATVDTVNGSGQLDEFPEAVKQAAVADEIFLTKADLDAKGMLAELEVRLRSLNPMGAAHRSRPWTGGSGPHIRRRAGAAPRSGDRRPCRPTSRRYRRRPRRRPPHRHQHGGIGAFSIVRDTPLEWQVLTGWLESVVSLRGVDLLRIKGLVNVAGRPGPVVVHGVQHVFHPPLNWRIGPTRIGARG